MSILFVRFNSWATVFTICMLLMGQTCLASTSGSLGLLTGFGARSAVLGGAPPADGDAESIYWNPAALATGGMSQALATHFFWLDSIAIDQLALVLPAPWKGHWGIAASLLSVPSFNSTNDSSAVLGSGSEGAIWLSGGLRLNAFIDLGVSAKFIFNQWMDENSQGGAIDLGIVYRPPWQMVQLQASLLNIGAMQALAEVADPLPTQLQSMLIYQLPRYDTLHSRFMLTASLDRDMIFRGAIGTEITIFEFLTFRGGYHLQPDNSAKWSAGLGVALEPFKLDYCIKSLPDLDQVHMITLHYNFKNHQGNPTVRVKVLVQKDGQGKIVQQFNLLTSAWSPLRLWHLKIMNKSNQIIRQWHGSGAPPEKIIWHMKNDRAEQITDDQGNHYQLTIEDEVFRSATTSGELLSQQIALAPKLRAFSSEHIKNNKTVVNFNFNFVRKKFEPKQLKIEYTSLDGRVIRKYSQIISEPHALREHLNSGKQIALPEGISGYKFTFIGANNQKQELTAPLIKFDPGLLLETNNLLMAIPLQINLERRQGEIDFWNLDIIQQENAKQLKHFQGKGIPPSTLTWTPKDKQHKITSQSGYLIKFSTRDKNGITWQQEIPMQLMHINDKSSSPNELKLEVNQILFSYDNYVLQKKAFNKLKAAALLNRNGKATQIIIKGHTDERGTDNYNRELSKKRAAAVRRYLVEEENIPESIVEIVGYGSSRPFSKDRDEKSRQKNRRVEILLVFPKQP